MLNREEILKLKDRRNLGYNYLSSTIDNLCDYWLERNPEKKIEHNPEKKITRIDTHGYSINAETLAYKINELIDAVNEMREGK